MSDQIFPDDGHCGFEITCLQNTIEFEKGQKQWATERLRDDELTIKQRYLYQRVAIGADLCLMRAKKELEEFTLLHFDAVEGRISA